MLLLGIDLGTSSIKVSIIDAVTNEKLVSCSYPDEEAAIISLNPGWAEQDPELWWKHTKLAIKKANASGLYNPSDIKAIGIAYQMHGLVVIDKDQRVLRNAIIWCDSRAVELGQEAFIKLSEQRFLNTHLNSPGNFTASKLAWVKQNEPLVYEKIYKFMLPGDYISMRLTGEVNTNISSLSEGILWDFERQQISDTLLEFYGIDRSLVPSIQPVFSNYGALQSEIAADLGLSEQAIVCYKSGDQPNNALSLNVFDPGEVAATAGTSGVIYAVSDQRTHDPQSRVNTFAHVNHASAIERLGVLLCINGTGIQNSWISQITGNKNDYERMNAEASQITIGADGVRILPFGNGAERMLNNKTVGAHIENLDFLRHGAAHLWRASQEGIAFAFRYGLDLLRANGITPQVIKAGHANLFLSPVFQEAFAGITDTPVELYDNDGSVGAALGAGLGSGIFSNREEAFKGLKKYKTIIPQHTSRYEQVYGSWKKILEEKL
ncbi:FGGY family carbohydrate kinase [Sphingobacterium sp. UT-1RO-CII-1]|uniref:xylulokinase n=1 Tax=Sphingobacterium sp. UT-1RO-CII-1 TaxID=2995225 RepID=UPI00227CEF53|nr:FGGY family carbohydrate kinase [Sphingobacterium sp. UT-1RO-CII-1]MCY4778100.1 FGGY family carbohydrate kinase [Sphingobacterium sp. UT-1RO-CII-1]